MKVNSIASLETLIDLEIITTEDRVLSNTEINNYNNSFVQKYYDGYISALSSSKISFSILQNLSLRAVKEFCHSQWLANYEKQKEVVGSVNDTSKPHLEGCFCQGKMQGYKYIQSLIN